jgi:hypothetical protein
MPTVGSSGGGDVVTLIGSGFGVHSYGDVNRTAFIGGTPCTLTEWVNSSVLKCTTPPGALQDRSVSIDVAGQVDTIQQAFSFGSPSCRAIAAVEEGASDGYYLLDQDGSHVMNASLLRTVWCNIGKERAGVSGRLGVYSDTAVSLWLDASSAYDLHTTGRQDPQDIHGTPAHVTRWEARHPVGAVAEPAEPGVSAGQDLRPAFLKRGVVSFDGIDDALITNVKRSSSSVTVVVAFRPDFGPRADGKCPSGASPADPAQNQRACAPGWVLSDNDLTDARYPKGLGIYVGLDGLVQVVVGSQAGLYSAHPLNTHTLADGCMHIVTVEASPSSVSIWVDGSSEPGLVYSPPQPLAVSAGDVNLTVGARGTHYRSRVGSALVDQDHFAGQVSEVVVIENVLPQAERARVERALVSRWQCNPVPPADGGHVRLRADAVVDESSTLRVELERM